MTVTEHPIIMQAHSVRAIIVGAKTQTRRVVRLQPPPSCWLQIEEDGSHALCFGVTLSKPVPIGFTRAEISTLGTRSLKTETSTDHRLRCPYGAIGDQLWVREAWGLPDPTDPRTICYRASDDPVTTGERWKSPLFMPRWASRLTLEITDVRVHRVNDISEADAIAEGETSVAEYRQRWDAINGKKPGAAWKDNPWVWVITFRKMEQPS